MCVCVLRWLGWHQFGGLMHFRVTFHATNDTTVMTLYFALISDIDMEKMMTK